jgi:hypothetical protein
LCDGPARRLGLQGFAVVLLACALGACGGEPEGGLLEVHASYDAAIQEDLATYRVLRVNVQGGEVDESREVERRGAPPDVFVVRSPVTVPGADTGLVVTIRVEAVRFTTDGEQIVACAQQIDVTVIDDAVNLVEVTLMPGDCS